MRLSKRILKSRAVHAFMVQLAACYIRFVFFTARKHYEIPENSASYMHGDANGIFAFWHGRMMLMPSFSPTARPMHVVISLHRDGVFISEVMRQFRFSTIAGSTSKNGREALMAILRALKHGENIAITPDGPRGPMQVAAAGAAVAAKLSGKPVIPVTFSARWHRRMPSWDRFMVAWPFSRVIFCVGEPIVIQRDTDDEAARLAIERAMNRLTDHADAALL